MSLSDDDQFRLLEIHGLEKLDAESSYHKGKLDPDFDRFKLLFDEPKFKEDESLDFKAMYDFKKEMEDVVFKPLIEIDEDREKTKEQILYEEGQVSDEASLPEEPELTPEEMGFAQGHEQGLEQGIEQGKVQGYEEGFKKGEAEGLIKGEDEGRKTGYEKGFEQGLKEGEEKGENQAKEKAVEFLTGLEDALKTADQTLDMLVDKYEEGILSLIQQIAKKTIMARIEMDNEIVKPMILEALKTLVQPEEITLSVSLEDYEYIEMIKDEFFEQIDSLTRVSVRSDPSLQKGDFNIETNTGRLSSDIESKLDQIFEAVKVARRQ